MTHDLLRNLITDLGAALERVLITDLRGNTFYAYLELRRAGQRLLVDARPSDAIALAIRAGAPVMVDTSVLEQARSAEVTSEQADQERLQRWLESLDPDEMGYKM